MKLKDYRYQIKGVDTPRPALECLQAIAIGLSLPIVISAIVVFADQI